MRSQRAEKLKWLVDLRATVKEKVNSEENTDSSVPHQSHRHDLFEQQSAKTKMLVIKPHKSPITVHSINTLLHRHIYCDLKHFSSQDHLRLTECQWWPHFSVFIAQTYKKKLTLKLNITVNSVKSLNTLKRQHLSNTIFRWVGKRMFWH